MPALLTRADALREYLTGAGSDGASQADPALSLGGYRASQEALSHAMTINSAVSGVTIDYASGGNPHGDGLLTAVDSTHLTWKPYGGSAGAPVLFGAGTTGIVEALDAPGQYVRVTGTAPFSGGPSTVTLTELVENYFGFPTLSLSQAASGLTQYRASIVKNVSAYSILAFQRWVALLGSPMPANVSGLGATGAGTIVTNGTFANWPLTGWCQVRTSLGVLKETVYYSSRSATILNVPLTGRALLGTTATIAATGDTVSPTPGIAIAIDTAGVTTEGASIQTVASAITAPTSVTWNQEITAALGLQVGSMTTGQQVGIWMKRHCPAGIVTTPSAISKVNDAFVAF